MLSWGFTCSALFPMTHCSSSAYSVRWIHEILDRLTKISFHIFPNIMWADHNTFITNITCNLFSLSTLNIKQCVHLFLVHFSNEILLYIFCLFRYIYLKTTFTTRRMFRAARGGSRPLDKRGSSSMGSQTGCTRVRETPPAHTTGHTYQKPPTTRKTYEMRR